MDGEPNDDVPLDSRSAPTERVDEDSRHETVCDGRCSVSRRDEILVKPLG